MINFAYKFYGKAMEEQNIFVSVRVADSDSGIPGGEISACILAENDQSAVENLHRILAELSAMDGRCFNVLSYEIFENDNGETVASITIDLPDIEEIEWATFYYKLTDIGIDDPDDVDPSELAELWIGEFFDEDNQILIDLISV